MKGTDGAYLAATLSFLSAASICASEVYANGPNRFLRQSKSRVMLTCDYRLRGSWVRAQFVTFGTKECIELDHVIDKSLDLFVGLVTEGGRSGLSAKDSREDIHHALVIVLGFFLERIEWLRGRGPGKPCHSLTANRDQRGEIQEGLALISPYVIRATLPPALSFRAFAVAQLSSRPIARLPLR